MICYFLIKLVSNNLLIVNELFFKLVLQYCVSCKDKTLPYNAKCFTVPLFFLNKTITLSVTPFSVKEELNHKPTLLPINYIFNQLFRGQSLPF